MKQMQKLLLITCVLGLLVSCKKNELKQGPNNEKTIVKLPQGEEEIFTIALDAKPGVVEVQILDIRRDVKTEADLNKTMIVKIQNYPTAITDYNAAHGTSIVPFTGYTLNTETPFDGTNYTVTFNPGEFAKFIKMKFDPTALDLSKRYALGFKVNTIDPTTGAIISSTKQVALIEISVKNKYDGRYRVTGTMVDVAAPTITGYFPQDVALVTTSATQVVMIPDDLGIAGHLILSGGIISYYGSFGPVFTFDLATDKIIAVTNSYGQPASNTRSAELDPSGANKRNADKSIDVKYFMKQPNTVTTSPFIRVTFNEHFEYLGPRG